MPLFTAAVNESGVESTAARRRIDRPQNDDTKGRFVPFRGGFKAFRRGLPPEFIIAVVANPLIPNETGRSAPKNVIICRHSSS